MVAATLVGCRENVAKFNALPGQALSFAQLAPTSRLEVRYATKGCFHNDVYDLVFAADAVGAVTATGSGTSGYGLERIELAPRRLSAEELRALDRSLTFYRSRPAGWCTTSEQVRLVRRGDPGPVVRERYTHSSCALFVGPGNSSLSLFRLIAEQGAR